jgi:type IV pilus assembly protein PilP
MKPSFKLTTTILAGVLAGTLASAQSPTIIQNTRNTMNAVHDNQAAASNAALGLQKSTPAAAPTPAARSSAAGAASVTPSAMKVVRSKTSKAKSTVAIHKEAAPKAATADPKTTAPVPGTVASSSAPASENDAEDPAASEKKYNPNGRRDPFLSPVVNHGASGSGCSTGKKCLEIGTISLQGIVRSDTGFIAVVSNGLNKAYFLRENDPVFNGYVVKITGDSIVFQETMQDRLGKTFTREVVKKITTPAV